MKPVTDSRLEALVSGAGRIDTAACCIHRVTEGYCSRAAARPRLVIKEIIRAQTDTKMASDSRNEAIAQRLWGKLHVERKRLSRRQDVSNLGSTRWM